MINKNTQQVDLISVCVCTYKRPEMLTSALNALISQKKSESYFFEIIIVDNDFMRSSENTVNEFKNCTSLEIKYDCEPEQNIALARNRAVTNANGNLIAFIDDDEVPIKNWLCELYNTLKRNDADGVLGPVLPYYSDEAPEWIKKCNIIERKRFKTGTLIKSSRDTRTGNVLLVHSLFPEDKVWFDPAFGKTGGEDVDFFKRHLKTGREFVWCDEALAYETIPQDRWKCVYYIKRYFRAGTINGERIAKQNYLVTVRNFFKSMLGVIYWLAKFFFCLPLGKHVWFKAVLKISYFCGGVLSSFGISFLRERD